MAREHRLTKRVLSPRADLARWVFLNIANGPSAKPLARVFSHLAIHAPPVYLYRILRVVLGLAREPVTHYGNSRGRYILDKSYWLVSSFNGNVVPLNGVHTGLKRERKNKRIKYKPDGGTEMAIGG